MSTKETRINKKVIIIACIVEVALIAAILFSIFSDDPDYKTYVSEGQKLLKSKQYEKAIESFDNALDINATGVDALAGKADGYMGLDKYDEAIPLLEKAIGISPSDPTYYDRLITALVKTENIEKANDVITEIIYTNIPTDKITSVLPAPAISPSSGSYDTAIDVTIEGSDDGTLYYTTNGMIPTAGDNKYEKPINLNQKGQHRIMALIIRDNGLIGFPATGDYTLNIESEEKESENNKDEAKISSYLGTWTDGETKLSITSVSGDKVKFNIHLSWVDESIKTSSSGTVKDATLNFSYTDNWKNKGTGTITFGKDTIGLKISETKSSSADSPGFGNYSAVLHK